MRSTRFTKKEFKLFFIVVIEVYAIIFPVSAQIEEGLPNVEKVTSAEKKTSLQKEHKNHPNLTLYSLNDFYNIAKDRNISVIRSQNEINKNLLDLKSAKYHLLPSVSYSLGHYFSFGKNIDPVTNTFVNHTFVGGYTALGLQLQLFSGFNRINTIKQAAYFVRAAEYAKKGAELELLTNITLNYARLLLDKEQLIVQRNNIQNTSKVLEVVNEKINVGRLSKYEFYTFNARLNTEQADMVTIENDSITALQNLRQLINFSYQEDMEIAPIDTTAFSKIYAANISPDEFIDEILINHPAVRQAEMNKEAARLGEKIAKGSFFPSLFVGGNLASNYNMAEEDANGAKIPLKNQLNNNFGQNINIGLSIPVFSQLQNLNRVKKERINIFNAQLYLQEAKNTIVTNTLQVINDFNGAKQKFTAIFSAWQQNSLSYNLYEEKYKLGQISSVELLAARDILNASTAKYLQAKIELFFQFQILQLLKESNQ